MANTLDHHLKLTIADLVIAIAGLKAELEELREHQSSAKAAVVPLKLAKEER